MESSAPSDILDFIGDIGVYQITLFLTLGAMEYLGADSIAMNFMGGFMDHWCMVEPLQNYSYPQQQYIAIPFDADTDNGYSECYQFNFDYDNFTDDEFYDWNRTVMTEGVGNVKCNQWVYDRSDYASTIRNRYDLVCDQSWLVEMVSTVYMAGRLIGALACGFVSDWLGRKAGVLWFNVSRFFGALLALYAQNYTMFAMGRFFMAIGSTGSTLCAFVLITELIGSKYRAALGTLWQCIFSIGYMTMPWIAYFVRDETHLQAVATWPLIVYFLYAITTQESLRWLVSQKKENEAEDVLQFIADVNGTELPDNVDLMNLKKSQEKKQEEVKQKRGKFLDLFKYPNLRKKTFIIYFNWFTNSLVYYGLSLNTGRLPGNVYVNTFLMGAVEIPANLLAIFLMNKIGRKWQIGISCICGGISSMICVILIVAEASPASLTTLSILGKACITMAFSGIYVYSVEIFPTEVRNIGMGSSSMCARISGMAAPFVGGPLADLWAPMPSLVFALFAFGSGGLMFLLPETLNKKLPETIAEAEEFGKKTDNILDEVEVKRDDDRWSIKMGDKNSKIFQNGHLEKDISSAGNFGTANEGYVSRESVSSQL